MLDALHAVAYMYAKAKGTMNVLNKAGVRHHFVGEGWDGARYVAEEIAPTFLLIKLGSLVEEIVNTLWSRRFPEIKAKSIHHEDKLRVMRELHALDIQAFKDLWALRNACSHALDKTATWAEVDRHFSAVHHFLKPFEVRRTLRRLGTGRLPRVRRRKATTEIRNLND